MSEIWYAYALIGNMVVGNIAVEKMVIGKKWKITGLDHKVPMIWTNKSNSSLSGQVRFEADYLFK
jgi:hypothetical protein